MIEINKMSNLGLGTYRMEIGNKTHQKTISYAVENGINLIDTASNYQFGNSEKLIGSVLNKKRRKDAFIISKAGYINGNDINVFSENLKSSRSIKINESFYYSIEPNFIEKQIINSLKRLNTDYLDGFLIHNPEHYFDVENENQKHIYSHLNETCFFLEDLVKKGIIRYYGISSNALPTNGLDLQKILGGNNLPNFKLAQFPYNLIENEASKRINKESLIDFCKNKGIKTFANRPLNTKYNNKVLRLANYSDELLGVNFDEEDSLFESFLSIIKSQLQKFGESSEPGDFTPIKFFINNRKIIANPEAVMKAVNSYLLPFMNQLQFSKSNEVFVILKNLIDYWVLYSKKDIGSRSDQLKKELNINDSRDISLVACENYLKDGIDHVLVGMRKEKYIKNLMPLL